MKVYRIEHRETGKGICQVMGNASCFVYRLAAALAFEAPEFEHDNMPCKVEQCKAFEADTGDDAAHMRYAFPTLKALREWFPGKEGRKAMQSTGVQGVVYEVEGELVAKGPWQVIFDLRTASKVGEFDLGDLPAS